MMNLEGREKTFTIGNIFEAGRHKMLKEFARIASETFLIGMFYIPAKMLAVNGHVFWGLFIFGIFSYVYGFSDGRRN